MRYLYGSNLAEQLNSRTKERVVSLIDKGIDPHLAVVVVGEDANSLRYVDIKSKKAQELGIILSLYHLEEGTPVDSIKQVVSHLAADAEVHGVMVQLPLPDSYSREDVGAILSLIPAPKDIDGLTDAWQQIPWRVRTFEEMVQTKPRFMPPTVAAIVSLLDSYDIAFDAKETVLVGGGRLVGRPLSFYLGQLGISHSVVDETTEGILDITSKADILVAATGQENLITYEWVKEGSVVIDCSFDVHEDSVSQVAEALAPAKGGIGPLTVAWLLHNAVQAVLLQEGA